MKLLILTNYFTPDLSAGSFRMHALVEALGSFAAQGLEVDLITTKPNRYASLRAEALEFEDRGWLRIHRVPLPSHRSGMVDQARAYLTYALAVRRLIQGRSWDLVFATSSRLMTAAVGAYVARRVTARLYLDIRDLFTANMDELLDKSPLRLLLPAFRLIERRAFRAACRINVVSDGFLPHVHAIAPGVPVSSFTNGIDEMFLHQVFDDPEPRGGSIPLVLYAGNIGEGQGLHRIVPSVAKALEGRVRFKLIGDGGKRQALHEALAAQKLTNVELLAPVSRSELIDQYKSADILFLHLNDLESFRTVLPSKLFEYAATGKPIVAGIAGHAANFVATELPEVEVFAPCDTSAMIVALERLLGRSPEIERSCFCKRFARSTIMTAMAEEVMGLAQSSTA